MGYNRQAGAAGRAGRGVWVGWSAVRCSQVRAAIGLSLVDQAQSLFEEAMSLLTIWNEYHEETLSERMLVSCRLSVAVARPARTLPEPPAVRQRLEQEISFLIKNLKEKNMP